jgi:hypothetical protein
MLCYLRASFLNIIARAEFPIDSFSRHCLLNGVDELGYIMRQEGAIAAYEAKRVGSIDTRGYVGHPSPRPREPPGSAGWRDKGVPREPACHMNRNSVDILIDPSRQIPCKGEPE